MNTGKLLFPRTTVEEILSIMEYSEEQRGMIWKVRRSGCALPGHPVGGRGRGQVRLGGKRVYTSHIVWFIHNGNWPIQENAWVDHKDGDINNELIENLRLVTASQNNQNSSVRRNKKVESKGVSFSQGKFAAGIQKDGKRIFLGRYETEAEAAAAYEGASRALHGEFSVFNRS